MKKLFILSIAMIIFSCSSSPTQNKSSAPEQEDTVTAQPTEIKEAPADPEVIEKNEPKQVQSTPASMYSALNEAIKSQNDDAIQKATTEILAQNSKDVRALNSLAVVYYRKGKLEAAQFLLNKAIVISPSSAELFTNLGLVQLAKNDRRDAIKTMRKALEMNPQEATAGANLGSLYVQDKDYHKAALSLEIPIKQGFKDYKTLNNYAVALTGIGKTKEAGEIYEKLLKENPSQREVMLNYSILLIENMNKNKEGLDLLNRLKFVGAPTEARDTIKNLEIKAKAGLQ